MFNYSKRVFWSRGRRPPRTAHDRPFTQTINIFHIQGVDLRINELKTYMGGRDTRSISGQSFKVK